MYCSLLLLYWPDFHAEGGPSRGIIGHALRRHLCALYEEFEGYAWDPDAGPSREFPRWGIELLPGPPDAETAAALLHRHPEAETVILAMSAERAAPMVHRLTATGLPVEVWTPGEENGSARSLRRVLHLDTAHPLALIIDGASFGGTAVEFGRPVEVADRVLEVAGMVGSVVQAPVFETDGTVTDLMGFAPDAGPSEPGILPEHLATLAEADGELRTWILVSHAPWVEEAVRLAHDAGVRLLLWPPDAARVSAQVLSEADGWCPLTAVLGLAPRVPSAARGSVAPSAHAAIQAEVRIASHTTPRVPARADEAATDEARRSSAPLPVQSLSDSARLGPWVRLMYHVECMQRGTGLARIAVRDLAACLAEIEEFGPSAAHATMWLNRARVEGLLLVEEEPSQADAALAELCRAHGEHPVCRSAAEVPDRCLRLLFQMLQKIPWVSFKLLRSVLMREQWLGGPPYRLDEATVDEWLNFLIQNGAIRMTKEPNLVNPEYPVTALRLNEEHPLSRSVASDATESTRLAAERAILAVDHFLTRNRKPWMAMGALRRALDGMSREELQSVLQGLQNMGALITESYPNPQKEHFTTGCRLKLDEPIVARALEVRNTIIQATQRHGRDRSWVPVARLEESLADLAEAASAAQRLAWLVLLRDEGILELEHEPILPGHAWDGIRCRLNASDAVVRSIIADRSDPAYYEAG